MTENEVEKIRRKLHQMLEDLSAQDSLRRESQKTVELDQQSVGRLSRMDALQQQAMAKAQQTRRTVSETRIRATLQRIDEGEFGFCADCGEEIEPKRLELDPTTPKCVSCARG